ncbi:MAG: G-D-S-L family lipolytic protein, partial [Candidatus Kapabacteria bacterium]|nr:G-D-S-L family lipolytic protein [Candidatus Kapabacteria bacterium]
YNSIIAAVVEANKDRMALVDINSIFNAIAKNGYAMPGSAPLRKDYISGGIFSLDGVHPTRKGAALIATEFLRVINRTWKSDFPLINPNDVPGLAIE